LVVVLVVLSDVVVLLVGTEVVEHELVVDLVEELVGGREEVDETLIDDEVVIRLVVL
jgi:hypothetical protein